MGRLTIVKTQGIAQIQYLASNIIMPQEIIKKINKLTYNFIWKGPDKIKRTIARRKMKEGGLAMPDAADPAAGTQQTQAKQANNECEPVKHVLLQSLSIRSECWNDSRITAQGGSVTHRLRLFCG